MPRVQTYVFFDTETTGLPREEDNRTRITEFSLLAVKREHLLETRPGATPRVQHRITLCLNPYRLVSPVSTEVTGLDNDLLEHEPTFKEVFTIIDTFLKVLTQPVCLIAHNGNRFDFPILKNHLKDLNFTADVLCADCFHCFYHVLERKKKEESDAILNTQDMCTKTDKIVEVTSNNVSTPSSSSVTQTDSDEIDFHSSNISMQAINETTPKSKRSLRIPRHFGKAVKRRFPWGDDAPPKVSYKLKDIYERVLNKPAKDAHRSENDCMFALEVSVALAKEFVEWVDDNNTRFADVKPMTTGVRM